MDAQVKKGHYRFEKYCDQDRFSSYWCQIKETLALNPRSVLEVGVGDKVFSSYLKNNTNILYKSFDLAEDLAPDIVGNVTDMKVDSNSFDVVCAFEILEHIPFEDFSKAIRELERVSEKYVVLSLPHWGRHFSFKIRLPFFKKISFQYKLGFLPIKHVFLGEHYWEIGKKGYSIKKIRKVIEKSGLKIIKDYVAFESPYHHFFVLKSN